MIKFKLLSDKGRIPTRGSDGSAGLDLYASEDFRLEAKNQLLVNTALATAIPPGYVGLVWPRSGLSDTKKINIGAGVIDSDYRGELKVLLQNSTSSDWYFNAGDKIAQLVVVPCITDIKVVAELDDTQRGAGGFGHTGS